MIYGPDNRPANAEEKPRQVEVVRSFSFKLNLGNYQSADFFCSQKAQCGEDEVDSVSADLYEWCFDQVMASVREVQKKQAMKAESQRRTA